MEGLSGQYDSEAGWEYVVDSFDNENGTYDLKVVRNVDGKPSIRLISNYSPSDRGKTNTIGRDYRDYVIGPNGVELDPTRDDIPKGASDLVSRVTEDWAYTGKEDSFDRNSDFDSFYSNPENDFEDNNLLPGKYKKPEHVEAHRKLTEMYQTSPGNSGLSGYGGITNKWVTAGKRKVLLSTNIGR